MEQVRPLHRRKAGIRLLCWLGLFLGVGWLHAALHPLLAQQGRGTPLGEVTDHPLRFRHLTIADGLSQNAVYAIVQDHRGFMWFGTKDGLNRYDGDTFVVFRHDPSSSTSLPDNHVTALFEDAGGRLWVGTQTGALARFDRRTETFVAYPLGTSARVTGIDDSPGGALWVATDGGGLYRLAAEAFPETAPSAVFRHDPGNPQGLSHDRVYAVLVDRTGAVWAGTEAGLDRIHPGTQAVHHYPADASQPGGVVGGRITALLEDDAGQLWAAGVAGLNRLDAGRTQIARYYHRYRTFRYGWGEALQLLQDRDGLLWIATHSELMRFDPAAERFSYHRHDPAHPRGINSNQPTALYQDRAGVIWIGTNGYGLNLYDPKAERFRTFRRPAGPPSRVAGFSVYTLFEDSGGDVWISNGILHRWDRASGTLFSYETTSDRPDDFGNTGVWSMVEAPTGTLWVGSSQGLYRYQRTTGHYRQYRHDPARPDGLPEQGVFGVFRDRGGRIWAVTENFLSVLVDPGRGRFQSYRYKERPTHGEWAFPSVHQDAAGRLWLASGQGLVRFDPETETFGYYRADPADPAALSHDVVRSICPDPHTPERYLWVGTAGGGLNRLDRQTDTFTRYTDREGLPNNVVYGILPDDEGYLWLSTNQGLSRFDPRTEQFRNFDADDGLQSNEFNSGAYFRSRRGELFFGGVYGFTYFFPGDVVDNPHVPPVVITGLKRINRAESIREAGTVLTRALAETDTLRLSYRDNVLTFSFAALDFSAPAKNRYAYRMEGFNEAWIETGGARTATYTNLPPGTYTFRVRGSNNDGVWNEQGAALTLIIAPPLWRSRWAYGLYALVALAALAGLRRYEMNRLRLKDQFRLEHMEAEKLRELNRAKSRFFANVSHEFRTPLTLILGPIDDLLAGRQGEITGPMQTQLELARRNAERVLDLIEQILEVARLEAGHTPMRARPLGLGTFVQEVTTSFVPYAERKAITFDVQVEGEGPMVYADPVHLEKVLANLCSNAIKFTPAGGTVRVSVTADARAGHVSVRDSGPGIPADELPHIFERFYRVNETAARVQPGTGIGLALVKELVELHGGSLTVESEEGFGCLFVVTLLRGRRHLTDSRVVGEEAPEWTPRHIPMPEERVAPAPESNGQEDVTTVLVVEDNADVRAYIRQHLEPAYRVVEASDGTEGLARARTCLPDLVLTDVMMPGLDGKALCQALKTDPETDFIPVILLTARAETEDRIEGLREHADDYLTKPFDVTELRVRIDNLIDSRRRLRARFGGGDGPVPRPVPGLHPAPVQVAAADAVFLDRVQAVVEAHLGDEYFTVEQLAAELGHSRGHLHRRLRALLDCAPSELLRTMRLERAAALLEARAGNVSEVAYAVGFKSVAHFSNTFLNHFGCRPSAYPEGPQNPV